MLVEDVDMLTLDTLSLKNTTMRSAAHLGPGRNAVLQQRTAAWSPRTPLLQRTGHAQPEGLRLVLPHPGRRQCRLHLGRHRAALFEESEIRSVGDSANANSGGYVLQARVPVATDTGYVFLNSR